MAQEQAHEKICPVCGAKSGSIQFIGPYCLAHVPIAPKFPESIEIQKCKCGRIFIDNKWSLYDEEKVLKYALEKVKGVGEQVAYDLDSGYVTAMIPFKGSLIQVQKNVPLVFRNATCLECSRLSGGAFQAIIQVRSKNHEKAGRKAASIAKFLSTKSFVCKEEELKEGFDIYAGERAQAIKALNFFKLGYVRTEKLHGQTKEGKRLFRTTLLVRLDTDEEKPVKFVE